MTSTQYIKVKQRGEAEAAAMLAELEAILHDWLAFRDYPNQGDKIRACDYLDTWIGIHKKAKKKMTDLYVCANEKKTA